MTFYRHHEARRSLFSIPREPSSPLHLEIYGVDVSDTNRFGFCGRTYQFSISGMSMASGQEVSFLNFDGRHLKLVTRGSLVESQIFRIQQDLVPSGLKYCYDCHRSNHKYEKKNLLQAVPSRPRDL